jgi:uncharacterized metal-binding protein YceD (DUF177 family)
LEAASAALEATPDLLEGRLVVRIKGTVVRVMGEIQASVERVCGRCDLPAQISLNISEKLDYHPKSSDDSESELVGEIELRREDLDVGWYEGRAILLDEVFAELLTLALPMRIVCRDKVVCQARTTAMLSDAFEEPETTVGHPAFAALKDLC